jgi:type II secretory pathway pseudopilin PulG
MTSTRLQPGGEFIGLVQKSPAIFKMAINLQSLRDLVSALVLTEELQIPPELNGDIEQIIDLTDNVLVELYRDPANALRASLGTSGADKTELLSKSLLRIRRQLTDLVMEKTTEEMQFDDSVSTEMKQAIRSYINRIRKYIDNEAMWSIQEDRLVMQFESSMLVNYQIIGVLSGLLLPAVQAARESARRMQSLNNVRQIMLSMHNYHDANGKFPAQAIAQGDGDPLLSWRVAILPYLGEQALYDQFHLDEPWDSDHNIKLLEQMPEVFRNPSDFLDAGTTTYLVPMGKGVGLSSKGLKMLDITDGTSNTLAVLDVDPELGVPWTKPEDLDIRQNERLDWLRAEGSNAGFFDGSARVIYLETDPQMLGAWMTYAGGEVVP